MRSDNVGVAGQRSTVRNIHRASSPAPRERGVLRPVQTGHAVASMGIAGPTVRFARERVPRLATLVREAAARAAAALGYASVARG